MRLLMSPPETEQEVHSARGRLTEWGSSFRIREPVRAGTKKMIPPMLHAVNVLYVQPHAYVHHGKAFLALGDATEQVNLMVSRSETLSVETTQEAEHNEGREVLQENALPGHR